MQLPVRLTGEVTVNSCFILPSHDWLLVVIDAARLFRVRFGDTGRDSNYICKAAE